MTGNNIFISYWRAFVDFLYPPVCKACGRPLATGERTLCTACNVHLPYTHYEGWGGNPTARAFYGRVPLQRAASVLFFTPDGRVQAMLHALKYKQQPEVGLYLGTLMGRRIGRSPLYADVDYIVPVPLHPAKLKKRGYNQAALLGQGMAAAWPEGEGGRTKPELLADLLQKRHFNESQTRKNRAERWDNVQAVYALNADAGLRSRVAGKHLLLVDDVMTTGATLESAATALLEGLPDVRLSVVTAATPA